MTHWQVCHQSGRVLFTMTARNREQFGWKVIKVDKSREQFEAEMAKLGDCVDMRRAKNGDNEYMEWDVALAWKMWQASREALDIELTPECWRTYYPDTDEHQYRAHSESGPESCARRIASEIGGYVVPVHHGKPRNCAAGIKVKE